MLDKRRKGLGIEVSKGGGKVYLIRALKGNDLHKGRAAGGQR